MTDELTANYECSQIVESLILMIDQEHCVISTEVIEQHLGGCEQCTAERNALELVKSLISRLCLEQQAPADLRLRITQVLTEIHLEVSDS